ncbi:PQQ-binding-like beta-propeller repeat protein [Luteolibacter marinus]|uniref:outer membrane protein assembly factor BamB family protein n=1 Tax=Luteolibacter marinus TaxID=2776705 RepID=UPI00186952CE|nr:PQQ-binding-like beta-propeller repeat protein [Luteolibacter marinus]
MKFTLRFLLPSTLALCACLPSLAGDTLEVTSPAGEVHRTRSTGGQISTEFPPGAEPASRAPRTAAAEPGVELREFVDPETGRRVDSEGNISGKAGAAPEATPAVATRGVEKITIDRMTVGNTYSSTYSPASGFIILGTAKTYFLSDGSNWQSGAGSASTGYAGFHHAEVDGPLIRYHFNAPGQGYLYRQTDYNAGNHSSNGTLGAGGPIILEAAAGSTTGTLKGVAIITANIPANYPEPRFNYWSSPLGSAVPFEMTVSLKNGATFTEATFSQSFTYTTTGSVDLANPVSLPGLTGIGIEGPAQVLPGSAIQFHAIASFESGALQDVSGDATWTVSPAEAATIANGLLTTQSVTEDTPLDLTVTYTSDGTTKTAARRVVCRTVSQEELAASWPTYQGNERHDGHIPISLEPDKFSLRWQRNIAPGMVLNPVTAADGKVFVSLRTYFQGGDSLFALDARDGETLWSADFGSVFSVNPPAYGYGNLYIQTGNHGGDTHLWAFDADNGTLVFKSPHGAQWERYYAPTIYDGKVYVNGGSYGGMYAFNAFTGANLWFAGLPQYDEFTPAVDQNHVYAYVGSYSPALYVVDRETGAAAYQIDDPNFDWNGWSMNLAPVLGGRQDVIAVHGGRLIRFDLENRNIAYEITGSFAGQPSVAKGVIYVINGGSVEARRQSDGGYLWGWTPASGSASEHLIVTDTHVIARTQSETHAIEILSGEGDWSYPAAGSMAIGEETLYIASATGTLTAISIPEFNRALPVAMEIEGPAEAGEFATSGYTAWVRYDDGRVRDRTRLCSWSVSPAGGASMDEPGQLVVGELMAPSRTVGLTATYAEEGEELSAEFQVDLKIGVSRESFIDRNLQEARSLTEQALLLLQEAERRENEVAAVLKEDIKGKGRTGILAKKQLDQVRFATRWGIKGQNDLVNGVRILRAIPPREKD